MGSKGGFTYSKERNLKHGGKGFSVTTTKYAAKTQCLNSMVAWTGCTSGMGPVQMGLLALGQIAAQTQARIAVRSSAVAEHPRDGKTFEKRQQTVLAGFLEAEHVAPAWRWAR